MKQYTINIIILLIAGMVLTACASLTERKRRIDLDNTLFTYKRTIARSNFETANTFRKAEIAERNPPDFARLDLFQVTSYDVTRSSWLQEASRYQQVVLIKYLHKHRMREKSLTDRQVWEYDKARKRWVLITPLPKFK